VIGEGSRDIRLAGNDLVKAKVPYKFEEGAKKDELKSLSNFLPST
jgi:hypothetical protein